MYLKIKTTLVNILYQKVLRQHTNPQLRIFLVCEALLKYFYNNKQLEKTEQSRLSEMQKDLEVICLRYLNP